MLVLVEVKRRYISLHSLLIIGVHCQNSVVHVRGCLFQKPAKKEAKKEPSASSKAAASRKRTKDGEEDSVKKKKPKKKKDPNAPKKPLSAFMFFSKNEREVGIPDFNMISRLSFTVSAYLLVVTHEIPNYNCTAN